jgi:hypothetical protein
LSGKFKVVKSVGQIAGYEDDDSFDDRMESEDYPSCHRHLHRDQTKGQPKRDFRTVKDIEDDIADSNIVSW